MMEPPFAAVVSAYPVVSVLLHMKPWNMRLLRVVKKDGTREMFDRNKLRNGIVRACEKRHISTEQIENMVNAVEHKVRNDSHQEVSTEMIGACVMDELKKVDQVAYVRFASVYREF